jgi:hypothetical protein
MAQAYSLVMDDLKDLQQQGYSSQAIVEALQKFNSRLGGDPAFTTLAGDLQRFTQEEQFLVAGAASVTETERGIESVFTPVIPGSPAQIRSYMKNGLETAYARVKGYQNQWRMLHAPGEMYGSNADALSIMQAVPYMNIWTGQYSMPKGMELPPGLAAGQPYISDKDKEAADWAMKNPQDPRSRLILRHISEGQPAQ